MGNKSKSKKKRTRFNKNLKFLRKQEKLTQDMFAELIGIDKWTISKMENDPQKKIPVKLIYAVSGFFGISTRALVNDDLVAAKARRVPFREPVMPEKVELLNGEVVYYCPECERPLGEDNQGHFCKYCGAEFDRKAEQLYGFDFDDARWEMDKEMKKQRAAYLDVYPEEKDAEKQRIMDKFRNE
ncbi:MAG: helix-turn-helix domain-containing protein [Anaerovoracaceae bacterium]|jgi:DNA-binding XRE family transcriptional regulator